MMYENSMLMFAKLICLSASLLLKKFEAVSASATTAMCPAGSYRLDADYFSSIFKPSNADCWLLPNLTSFVAFV